MDFIELRSHDGAQARISPYGAHLCSWQTPDGIERLFLSRTSGYGNGVAIRGGIPIIFPQFAARGSLPKHGFARTAQWTLTNSGQDAHGAAFAQFSLSDTPASRTLWPHAFRAELEVHVAGMGVQVSFSVTNCSTTSFAFSCALHTYFAVQDVAACRLHGLHGCRYADSLLGLDDCVEQSEALRIEGAIDRIYAQAPHTLRLQQGEQVLAIHSTGFADAVVWNPGQTGVVQLADMQAGDEQGMLCVEAANVFQPIQLQAGETWIGRQSFVAS